VKRQGFRKRKSTRIARTGRNSAARLRSVTKRQSGNCTREEAAPSSTRTRGDKIVMHQTHKRISASLFNSCLAILLSAICMAPANALSTPYDNGNTAQCIVYVNQVYYHTGLIIEMDANAAASLAMAPYFKGYKYIEIGWGEEDFYQNPDSSVSRAAKAILVRNPSVLRVEGFNQDIREVMAWSERTKKIALAPGQMAKLIVYINDSLKKDKNGKLVIASIHGSGEIIFFKSTQTYYLFNTCNTWVASALHYAGLDITPAGVVTAKSLFDKLNKLRQ
jgi:uncharacterized protein (TIGR02117 family)